MQTTRIGWLSRCCRAHIAYDGTGTSLQAYSLPCTCRHRPPVQLVSRCLLVREARTLRSEARESLFLFAGGGRDGRQAGEASISNLEQTTKSLTLPKALSSHSRCPFETLLLLHSRRHLSLDHTRGPLAFRLFWSLSSSALPSVLWSESPSTSISRPSFP